jgi:hypothetical protein
MIFLATIGLKLAINVIVPRQNHSAPQSLFDKNQEEVLLVDTSKMKSTVLIR